MRLQRQLYTGDVHLKKGSRSEILHSLDDNEVNEQPEIANGHQNLEAGKTRFRSSGARNDDFRMMSSSNSVKAMSDQGIKGFFNQSKPILIPGELAKFCPLASTPFEHATVSPAFALYDPNELLRS